MLLLLTHDQQLLVTNDPLLQVSLLLKTKSISVIVYTPLVIHVDTSAGKQTAPGAKKPRSVQGKFASKIVALFYTKYSNVLLLTHVLVCGVF